MNHIMDIVIESMKIIDKIQTIKQLVVSESEFQYTDQDARLVALDSIQMLLSSNAMWINCYNSLANKCSPNKELNQEEFLISLQSNLQLNKTEEFMFNNLRLGLLTLVHFKIDSMFKNILMHLKALPNRNGYWNLTKEILKKSGLPENGLEKKILSAFANLRNSQHSNGIHTGHPFILNIGDMEFKFEKDKKVICASWEHILVLLDSNISVIKKILTSPSILSISEKIKDKFSESIQTHT